MDNVVVVVEKSPIVVQIVESALGPRGPIGLTGLTGLDGLDGRDGADGRDGTNGVDGRDGTNGVDGRNGVDGTNGADGLKGDAGNDGADGRDGTNGVDGLKGEAGTNGVDGLKGDAGVDGRDGTNGTNGANGAGLDGTGISFTNQNTPARPSVGVTRLYSKSVAGKSFLHTIGATAGENGMQSMLMRNKLALWSPIGNSPSASAIGAAALTATGTATSSSVTTANRHTWQKRIDYLITVAAVSAIAGYRGASALWGRGAAEGDGGFLHVFRWGPATGMSTASATSRCFVGMRGAVAAPTDIQPETQLNIFGCGWSAGDVNMQIYANDSTGTGTKTDLGPSFPRPTLDRTECYETALYCAPFSNSMSYEITNLRTGAVAVGSISADLPPATVLLAPIGWISSGATSSVIGLALMIGGIESDF